MMSAFHFNLQFFKAFCTSCPSKIQKGASQCTWSKVDLHCSSRPPPTDPVVTILVALLTTIISVPILVFLNFLLDGYASNWPGSRGVVDDIGTEGETKRKTHIQRKDTPSATASEILRNSSYSSAYGEELKKGLPEGNAVDYQRVNTISQIAYAGTCVQSL